MWLVSNGNAHDYSNRVSLVASVSAAIAYSEQVRDARVSVSYNDGVLVLDGISFSLPAIADAIQIATSIADCPVRSRILHIEFMGRDEIWLA